MSGKTTCIGLIGASGRMGKAIAAITPLSFVPFGRANPPHPSAEVDIFLDVSTAAALEHNLEIALLSKKPIVIGTTGHSTFDCLREAAKSIPVLYSANFSLGIAILRWAATEFARQFYRTASIEIIETHHSQKKDAPSGTALMLARSIEEHHPATVSIQSIRSGQIGGRHELHFRSAGEHLTLIHEAQNLTSLAHGAIEAIRFLALQSPGFYTMNDVYKTERILNDA